VRALGLVDELGLRLPRVRRSGASVIADCEQ
jgi:hypothetical protein